ncbi:hypothetical protein CRENBAI_005786 [Crenichthys baileyi]|uniref:Uncharacterized protein n=1 Tax=Crenichthys baileyi TaxID=28760 RepID=A0AAV9RN27_9TELE
MRRTRGNKDRKEVLSEPSDGVQDGDQTEFDTGDGLDPALAKALSAMTSKIHATELRVIGKWLDEAETMLLAVKSSKAGHIKLERAHLTFAQKPHPNRRPRSLLLRFHSFREKQRRSRAFDAVKQPL